MCLQQKILVPFFLSIVVISTACSTKSKKAEAVQTQAASEVKGAAKSDSAPKVATEIKCSSGKDARGISVQPQGTGCQVVYTKHTEISPIASSVKGLDHCQKVAQKMRQNLEASGFKCQ